MAAMGIAALSEPSIAQITGERLVAPADSGFAPGVVQQRRSVFMSEAVPKDETLEVWTRMVTIQRFPWQPGVTPELLANGIIEGFSRVCGATTNRDATALTVEGQQAADLRADCPVNPQTGKPETMFGRVILGDEMIHMIQIAFRHLPSAAEAAWAERTIAATILCKRASGDVRCK
jgi:hypothetical protein